MSFHHMRCELQERRSVVAVAGRSAAPAQSPTLAPQLVQNFPPGFSGAPQCVQNFGAAVAAGAGAPAVVPGAAPGGVAGAEPAAGASAGGAGNAVTPAAPTALAASNVTAVVAAVLTQNSFSNACPPYSARSLYLPSCSGR